MKLCGMDYETLVNYQEGRTDATTTERVRTHLATGCTQCEAQLARLARLFVALPQREFVSAPQTAIARANALFRERFQKPARPSLWARLVFNSLVTPQLAGARGENAEAIQYLYNADSYDIDLWQEPESATTCYLIGQVLSQETGVAPTIENATLTSADGQTWNPRLVGTELHFTHVPKGIYELRLALEEAEIVVSEIQVGWEA